eukprot:g8492.t1
MSSLFRGLRSRSNLSAGRCLFKATGGHHAIHRTPGSFVIAAQGKAKTIYRCGNCQRVYPTYFGKCKECGSYNSIREETVLPTPQGLATEGGGAGMKVADLIRNQNGSSFALESRNDAWVQSTVVSKSLMEIAEERGTSGDRIEIPDSTGSEIDRVLGGGIVKGSLILLGGDPGVGKSTLLLQVVGKISQAIEKYDDELMDSFVLYVSSEESAGQIHDRASRLGFGKVSSLRIMTETRVESIIAEIQRVRPTVVVMDSIQSVFSPQATGSAGGIVQVKECAVMFSQFAKITNIPIFIVGHVTKSGEIAGPKVLEHIVDVVLYLDGERNDAIRILRAVKNRYGPTNEIGLFEMMQGQLIKSENPNAKLLHNSIVTPPGVASVVFVSLQDMRPVLVEIQALSSPRTGPKEGSWFQSGARVERFHLITSVLRRHVYKKLHQLDLVLNVLGGLKVQEPAGDLAIAIAIASAAFDQPIDEKLVAIGEIGLGGELHPATNMDKRMSEIAQLGFKKVVVPYTRQSSFTSSFDGLEVIECSSINQVLEQVLGKSYLAISRSKFRSSYEEDNEDY